MKLIIPLVLRFKLLYFSFFVLLFSAVFLGLSSGDAKGQDCTPKKRKYATRQEFFGQALLGLLLPGTISSPADAVDSDLKTASTLSVPVGVLNQSQATQYLQITSGSTYIPANTPVTVKLSLPTSILGVLDNVQLQPFTNLNYYYGGVLGAGARWRADAVGPAFTGASLVNLVNGVGELEFTVTPTQQYQGIWINVGSVVGLGVSAKVYSAYVLEDDLTTASCNSVIDVLSGVKAGAIGGVLDATSSIINPFNAADAFPLTTYTELNAGVNLIGEIFHTTIFKTRAQPGDVVKMILEKPGGGLLNLSLLSGFTIQLYNGPNPVGDPLTSASSGLLSLNLLPGAAIGETKRELMISVPTSYGAYDRVQVKIGGVATVGLEPGLRIYDVKRIILPKVLIDGTAADSKTVCQGSTAALSVNEPQFCTTYNWYTTSAGGTSVHSGSTYTPLSSSMVVGENVFYVEAARTNCTETSERIPVKIIVAALPIAPTVPGVAICSGTTANLEVTSPDANLTYNWYTTASGGTSLGTGTTFTTPALTAARTYYVEAKNTIAGCTSNTRTAVTVTIKAPPTVSAITGISNLCVGVGQTFKNTSPHPGVWTTDDPAIATVTASGFVFGASVGTTTIRYTITDAATGCSNTTSRVVNVYALPSISLNSIDPICAGTTTAVLSYSAVSSGVLDYSIIWDDPAFANVSNVAVPASAITLTIPGDSLPGEYSGTLVLRNTVSGCTDSYLINLSIKPKLPSPHASLQ